MQRKRLIRILLVCLAVVVVLVAVALALPYFIKISDYKDEIAAKVSGAIGRKVNIDGEISLSIFPTPHLAIEQVKVANVQGGTAPHMATVDRLSASVEFWPLLQRKIHIRSVTLKNPDISLEKLGDGRGNWTFDFGKKSVDTKESSALEFSLDEINIEGGRLSYAAPGQSYKVEKLDVTLTLVGLEGPYLVKGKLWAFGKEVALDAQVGRLSDPLKFQFAVQIDKSELKASGEYARAKSILTGDFAFAGNPSVAKAFKPSLEIPKLLNRNLGFKTRLNLNLNADTLTLSNAQLELKTAKTLFDAHIDWKNELKLSADVKNLPGQGHVVVSVAKHSGNYDGNLNLRFDNVLAFLAWIEVDAKSFPAALGKPMQASMLFSYGKALRLQKLDFSLQNARLHGDVSWHQEQKVHHIDADVKSPSLEPLLALFDTKLPSALLAGPISFSGQVKSEGKRVSIANLNTTFGSGLYLRGALSADLSKAKPIVNANLITSPLSVEMFTGPDSPKAATPASSGPPWSKTPINLDFLKKLDGQFDISTSRITRKDLVIGNPHIVAKLQNDTLFLAPLTGTVFGGSFNINASASADGTFKVKSSLNDANIKSIVPQDTKLKVVDGKLSFSTDITTQGKSVHDMVSHLNGRFSFASKNGTISGFDLDAVAQRLANLNDVESILALVRTAMAKGKTSFTTYNGDVMFNQGVGNISSMTLATSRAKASATGTIDLPRYTLNVLATAAVINPPNLPTFGVRFFGPIDGPSREYDTASLRNYLIQNVAKGLIQQVTKGQAPNVMDFLGRLKKR